MKQHRMAGYIGIALRTLRKEREWSQQRVAEASNLSLNCVGLLERNKKKPTYETLLALAMGFEITASEFIKHLEDNWETLE